MGWGADLFPLWLDHVQQTLGGNSIVFDLDPIFQRELDKKLQILLKQMFCAFNHNGGYVFTILLKLYLFLLSS